MPVQTRIPPHSLDAEVSVLGALLIDKDAIIAVSEFLRPEHFYLESHQQIYEAALTLYEKREPIDVLTVADTLKKKRALAKIGGTSYLGELVNQVPTSAHVEHYGRIVKDAAIKRSLMQTAAKLTEASFDDTVTSEQLLDQAEQQIFALSQAHLSRSFIPIKQALSESFDRLDELHKSPGGLRGIPTGFKDLDDTLAGFQRSNLIILASRPGVGKTTLALNIARHVTVNEKLTVGFFSLEMSQEELVDRLLVAQADIDAWRLKTGKLDEADFTKFSDAMGILADSSLFIDDTPGLSLLEMRTKARRLQVEKDLDLIIVDYLQLVQSPRKWDSRVTEVSEISMGLKNLARELKIPVLALSQLSRAVEQRGTKRPQLADLRESGSIEQDSDVVMFLWRENEDDLENIELSIAKHRNGPLRAIKLRFRGDRIRFFGTETKRS